MNQLLPFIEQKQHIIWDWNGTLLDDVETAVLAISKVLAGKSMPTLDRTAYRRIFGFPISSYYERIGLETSGDQMNLISDEFHKNYDQLFDLCKLHDGVLETLQDVKARGLCQSILSAAQQDWLMPQLTHFGIRSYFDHVFGLTDFLARSKLERGRQLIETSGMDRKATLMIGDTNHDIEVARDLGIDVVIYADGHQSLEHFSEYDVPVFLREISSQRGVR